MERQFVRHGRAEVDLCVSDEVCSPRILTQIERGSYEHSEMLFARRLVKPEDRVLELGAGLGFVSTVVNKAVTPRSYTAVEADPRMIPYIEATHVRNGVTGVDLVQSVFVTDQQVIDAGSVSFGVMPEFWGSSLSRVSETNAISVDVAVQDASAFVRSHDINVLIADIEGAELELLSGLDFGNIDRVLLETHPNMYGQDGLREVFWVLDNADFVYSTMNSSGPVVSFEKAGTGSFA